MNPKNLQQWICEAEGLLNVKSAQHAGFDKKTIDLCIENSGLIRLTTGIYLTPEAASDELFRLSQLSCDGVFSHETALKLNGLTEHILSSWTITIPAGSSAVALRAQGASVHFMKKDLFKLGMTEARSPQGRSIRVYNAERTLCDLLRDQTDITAPLTEEAFAKYASGNEPNYERLLDYAKQFKVEGILKSKAHWLKRAAE